MDTVVVRGSPALQIRHPLIPSPACVWSSAQRGEVQGPPQFGGAPRSEFKQKQLLTESNMLRAYLGFVSIS